jgi:CheY-like chemotaxis protein
MSTSSTSAVVVLIAEDETLVRMVVSEMLQDGGYHVYEAQDGQEALAILEVRGGSVRVLVTDIAMPNLGGLDLAALVSTRWPHVGVVVASAAAPPNVSDRMPKGSRFVAKPYTEKDLLKAVEAVLRTEQDPGPAVALHSFPTFHAGQMHGAGGLAQPLPAPEE